VRRELRQTVNAMSMLDGREPVEAGGAVRHRFWKENPKLRGLWTRAAGGWDTHGNKFPASRTTIMHRVRPLLLRLLETN